jgi:hypothetical protein
MVVAGRFFGSMVRLGLMVVGVFTAGLLLGGGLVIWILVHGDRRKRTAP